jgi:tetratricopeptide (TPR) repeat protein
MTTLTKTIQAIFPAAMIVVCTSVYFVYFDGQPPRSDQRLVSPGLGEESVTAFAKQTPESLTVSQDVLEIPPSPQAVSGTQSNTETSAPILEIPASTWSTDTPTPDLPLPPPSLPPDATTAESRTPAMDAPLGTSSAIDPSLTPTTTTVANVPRSPEPVAEQSNTGPVSPLSHTAVTDYWLGLERARTTNGPTIAVNTGVIANPYHRPDATDENVQPVTANIDLSSEHASAVVIRQPHHLESDSEIAASPPVGPMRANRQSVLVPHESQMQPQQPPITTTSSAYHPIDHAMLHGTDLADRQMPDQAAMTPPPISDYVRQRVLEHWEYGGSLARRNAIQLAKQEFFSGLSLLAESADQQEPEAPHLQALREGFLALEEVRDFQASTEMRQSDLAVIVQKHETPVIRDGHFQTESHSQARQAYLLYAKERIRMALAQQPLAAELLYSAGKLHLAAFEYHRSTDNLDLDRAMTLFECALLSDPAHAKSCNELAVIQAKNRDWLLAKTLLQRAVEREPRFLEAWQNLSKVHQRLGEMDLARLAAAQVEFLSQQLPADSTVRMVSNSEFVATAAAMDGNSESGEGAANVVPERPSAPVRFGVSSSSNK